MILQLTWAATPAAVGAALQTGESPWGTSSPCWHLHLPGAVASAAPAPAAGNQHNNVLILYVILNLFTS